ncbi:MAG: hypothetical protein U5R48_12485 [Gammaproteobacteria bacterium]|nr:hypothetical protein [Gammaproteobacteria bacterium]
MFRQGVSGPEIGASPVGGRGKPAYPVQYVPEARLRHEVGAVNHQGVVARAARLVHRDGA